MKINPNLFPRHIKEGSDVQFVLVDVAEILKPYIGQKITLSFDVESTHDDTTLSVYPYQTSGVSIDNNTNYYTVGKTKKRIVEIRTVTQLPSNTNTGQIIFYNSDTTKKIKVTNIKIELGTEATPWIPHRDDLTPEQQTLIPEHLFGGGYRLEGDSSDIATDRWWKHEGTSQSVTKQQEYQFTTEQQTSQQLCEDKRRRKCLSIYRDFRHRTFDLFDRIFKPSHWADRHSISLGAFIGRFKASLLARRGHEPVATKRCMEKIECYFNGSRRYEITKPDGEGHGGRRLYRHQRRSYGKCRLTARRHMASSIRGFTTRAACFLSSVGRLHRGHVNLAFKGVVA